MPPCVLEDGFELREKAVAAERSFWIVRVWQAGVEAGSGVHGADGVSERVCKLGTECPEAVGDIEVNVLDDDTVRAFDLDNAAALRIAVIGIGLILMLSVLYKVAPKHKHPWYRGVPGAFLAAAVFIVASVGLRLYLSYVYSHGLTYGALATPITFLLFYYFVSMAVIIGAQFNNAMLEYFPPGRSKREQRKWRAYDPARDAAPETPPTPGKR